MKSESAILFFFTSEKHPDIPWPSSESTFPLSSISTSCSSSSNSKCALKGGKGDVRRETRLDCFFSCRLRTFPLLRPTISRPYPQMMVAFPDLSAIVTNCHLLPSLLLRLELNVLPAACLLRQAVIRPKRKCPETPPKHRKFSCSGTAANNDPWGRLTSHGRSFVTKTTPLCSPPLPRKHLSAGLCARGLTTPGSALEEQIH